MHETWRLLITYYQDAFANMAIEEAILREIASGNSKATLRFFTWQPSAVSIGYFQSMHEEINLERCKALGVDTVRRITGCGAVYHDSEGEITYSIIVPESYKKIPKHILKSYKILCQGLIEGFRILGLKASFQPINNIIVNNKKISGSAQTRKFNVILQHGTILYKVKPSVMFSLLKVPKKKREKLIKRAEERVTSLSKELGRSIEKTEIINAMRKGFERSLGIKLLESSLTEKELSLSKELRVNKYATKAWNFMR